MKKTHKRIIGIFFMLLALVLFAVNAVIIWVVTGPRSLDALRPYVESALASKDSPYHIAIGSSELVWDGWQHPIAVHVKNVEVLNTPGAVIAHFPEINMRMHIMPLLMGRFEIKSLEVQKPSAVLVQGADGSLSFGLSNTAAPSTEAATAEASVSTLFGYLVAGENDNVPMAHLRSLIIHHAVISVKKSGSPTLFLQSSDASLEVTRKNGRAKGSLSMPLQFGDKTGALDANFVIDKSDKSLSTELVYTDVPSAIVQQLFPSQHWMNAVQMPLSGWANALMDFDAHVNKLDFMVEAGPGVINYPEQFEAPLDLQRIRASGTISDKMTTLTLKDGLLDFKIFQLAFSGTARKDGEKYGLDIAVDTQNVPIDDMHRYWPRALSPHTREWVGERISKGVMTKASLKTHFKPGELELKDTPEAAIDAHVEVKGASVRYMPRHPLVTEVDASMDFTGKTMDANATRGKYLSGSIVNAAHVKFPDLNAADVRMFLDMDVEAPAKDVQEFLSLPELNKAKKLNLTKDISGQVKGNAKLDFIAFSDDEEKNKAATGDINYAVSGTLMDVTQPAFMHERDIAHANMKISLNNKQVKAEGKASVNGLPMTIDLTAGFGKNHPANYAIQCDMPLARMADFGLPKLNFAHGSMGVDALFQSTDSEDKSKAKLDLTQTSIDLPQHSFAKKAGEKATLQIDIDSSKPGTTLIQSFAYSGVNATASGKAIFSKALDDFSLLAFDKLRVGNHDLTNLEYKPTGKGFTLVARGRVLDAEPYLRKSGGKSGKDSYDLDVKVDKVLLGSNRALNNVTLKADCGEICHSVKLESALADSSAFYYTIAGGELTATCDNAGELMRTLGIYDTIGGGKMLLKGDYQTGKLAGMLSITDYTLKKAPVLTRMFTIASLTGIVDTLSGNGIAFTKLTAPYVYGHDIIQLKEAKAHGPAIGITADGTIDLDRSTFDLEGVLVPGYTINSMAGNVPLIGELLTGGKGQGIIALNYSVKGDMKDPSIHVNPLSAFTPGFLRNIFNIFDKPAPSIDEIDAQKKRAEQKKPKEPALENAEVKLENKPSEQKPSEETPAQPEPKSSAVEAKPSIPENDINK